MELVDRIPAETPFAQPDLERMRSDALQAGGVDPMSLRFRVVEYEKHSGELVGVPVQNSCFREAVLTTAALIREKHASHFCLEPVGFLQ